MASPSLSSSLGAHRRLGALRGHLCAQPTAWMSELPVVRQDESGAMTAECLAELRGAMLEAAAAQDFRTAAQRLSFKYAAPYAYLLRPEERAALRPPFGPPGTPRIRSGRAAILFSGPRGGARWDCYQPLARLKWWRGAARTCGCRRRGRHERGRIFFPTCFPRFRKASREAST